MSVLLTNLRRHAKASVANAGLTGPAQVAVDIADGSGCGAAEARGLSAKLRRMSVLPSQERQAFLCAGLVCASFALYWPAVRFPFVNFDDPFFVVENAQVQAGLSWDGFKYAFSSTVGFWHPLTWLSLMLDSSLSGGHAATFHLTNVWIHSINSCLVFLLSHRLSRLLWPSALVALLFCWHPLNVESVAWVSERKGLLGAMFGLLSLWYYIRYAYRAGRLDYSLMCLFFLFSLMSKPILLFYPVVLLCLDWWPLRRFGWRGSAPGADRSGGPRFCPIGSLIAEKTPLIVGALVFLSLTAFAESRASALKSLTDFPPELRLYNGFHSLFWYAVVLVVPHGLSFYYPYPKAVSVLEAVGLAVGLISLVAFVLRRGKDAPQLLVALSCFLLLIMPTIGFLQIGRHARADRYMYLAALPVFCLAIYGTRSVWARRALKPITLLAASGIMLFYFTAARGALQCWGSSRTLCEHALRLCSANYAARLNLSSHLIDVGEYREALSHLGLVLTSEPHSLAALHNAGVAYQALRMEQPARDFYRRALHEQPGSFLTLVMLARLDLGSRATKDVLSEAKRCARRAVVLSPSSPVAWELLVTAFFSGGETRAATRALTLGRRLIAGSARAHERARGHTFQIGDSPYGH